MLPGNLNNITHTELNINIEVGHQLSYNFFNDHFYTDWAKRNILDAIDHHAENLVAENSIIEIDNLEIDIDISADDFFGNDTDKLQAVIWDKIYYELKNTIATN